MPHDGIDQNTDKPRPWLSVMSKKRYFDIEKAILTLVKPDNQTIDESDISNVMCQIRAIMKFDPADSKYTPELGKKAAARIKERAKEQGTSTYGLSGRQKNYEKTRQAKNVSVN
jgi:hypothetical protein